MASGLKSWEICRRSGAASCGTERTWGRSPAGRWQVSARMIWSSPVRQHRKKPRPLLYRKWSLSLSLLLLLTRAEDRSSTWWRELKAFRAEESHIRRRLNRERSRPLDRSEEHLSELQSLLRIPQSVLLLTTT